MTKKTLITTGLALCALATIPTLTSCDDCCCKAPAAAKCAAACPLKAAADLVARVTPEYADKVNFLLDESITLPTLAADKDNPGKLIVTAPSVHEAIRAYGYYLRHLAKVHLSWNGDNRSAAQFVLPEQAITVPAALPFNYALNYCTLSYTCLHWDKARWEKELDRFALAGYTHMLVTSGLEKVWQNFLRELGQTDEQIGKFIPNPSHSAWWNMGNLEGEGGPVSQTLIDSEAGLGRFIVSRLRELGMEPVLQGYVGFLPHDYPMEGLLPQGDWCGYMRPAVVPPTSPEFAKLAELWYKELHKVYGYAPKYYGGDLFHECGNKGNIDLKAAAAAVQAAMPGGTTWLLQAWGYNPDGNLLSGTDPLRTIVLELDKDNRQGHGMPGGRGGRAHVWCELANFGGKHGMFGGVGLLETIPGTINGSQGIGLLSEGLETNPFYYAVLTERINNREPIDRASFIKDYAYARYGSQDERLVKALTILADTVYKPTTYREGGQENIMCARPSLHANKVSTWADPSGYYEPAQLVEVRDLLRAAAKDDPALAERETFRYDLADVTRQTLADAARPQLERCREAFDRKDIEAFNTETAKFIDLIKECAAVLATSEHFLMGKYLEGVAGRGTTEEDKKALVRSAKQLYTTWRKDIGGLDDYSHRQFSEMMTHYYIPRWEVFFNERKAELAGTGAAAETIQNAGNDNNGIYVESGRQSSLSVDGIELAFPTTEIPLMTEPAKAK